MLIYDSVYVKSLIVKALAALEPSTNIVNIDVAGCQHWRTLTSSGGVHCSGVPDLHLDGEAVPGDDDALLLVLAERRALPGKLSFISRLAAAASPLPPLHY